MSNDGGHYGDGIRVGSSAGMPAAKIFDAVHR
jgi:hypothetical protein